MFHLYLDTYAENGFEKTFETLNDAQNYPVNWDELDEEEAYIIYEDGNGGEWISTDGNWKYYP